MDILRCVIWFPFISSLFIVSAFLVGPSSANSPTVLEGATLIDGTGGPSRSDAVVVIEGNTISAIGKKGEVGYPHDANIQDVSGQYIIPGLIDMHAHIPVGPFVPRHVDGMVRMRVGYDAAATAQFLKTLLAFGITTARSTAGSNHYVSRTQKSDRHGRAAWAEFVCSGQCDRRTTELLDWRLCVRSQNYGGSPC